MSRIWLIIAVAGGGAFGALARWAITMGLQRHVVTTFPIGTFAANAVGCLLVGFCYVWLDERTANPLLRHALMIGLIGALTTFSTYCIESITLMEKHQYMMAAVNLAGSVVVGLIGAIAGVALGRAVLG